VATLSGELGCHLFDKKINVFKISYEVSLSLRRNFRAFPRGKRKGFSPVQLEGLNASLNDWSDFLYSGNKAIPEETLFLSGRLKDGIFSKSPS